MISRRPGRNDPCPCGSGKKFKRCCGDAAARADSESSATPQAAGAAAVMEELLAALRAEIAGREFGSLEELQTFMDQRVAARNQSPVADFAELSPDQMRALIARPFDSPHIARFVDVLPESPQGALIECFRAIDEAIDEADNEKGLRLTAKGNLPRALARSAAERVLGPELYAEATRHSGINREDDFRELSRARLSAEKAGLLRRAHGRIHRTRRCEELLQQGSYAAIYPPLFEADARRFAWGAFDRFPALPILQSSFAFSLRMLQRHGEQWQPTQLYEDLFVRAYPAAIDACPDTPYFSSRDLLMLAYRTRVLERFAEFCGLVEIEPRGNVRWLSKELRVRKTRQLDQLVWFEV